MRWELLEQNELTDALAAERERRGLEVIRLIDTRSDLDLEALAAVVGAAQTYLILRAKTVSVYSGVDLQTEAGHQRIDATLELIIDRVLGGGT